MSGTAAKSTTAADGEKETYFSHPERLFPRLEPDGRIPTAQFLSACQGIADFVGFLGVAFTPVKKDIAGNIQKVRERFDPNKDALPYLQQLIDIDLAHDGSLGRATEGLLWLKRGLEFMLELLKGLVRDYRAHSNAERQRTENMGSLLAQCYEATLKRHHGFVSRQLFKVVIHAAPYRRDLLKALAYGHKDMEAICVDHIAELLPNFESSIASLVNYYYEKRLESRP